MLVTDFYSKYFKIELLRHNTASCVINNLEKMFARFGVPDKVVIMVPSTAIPGILSTALLSPSNLPKIGVLSNNGLSRVPAIKWCSRETSV